AKLTREVAATWLAMGLDPQRVLFYRQSDIPEIFELAWVLACYMPKSRLNNAHAYKAMIGERAVDDPDIDTGVNMGLYNYPLLMAADILAFDIDFVPVGKDQKQHLEIAREAARHLNHSVGKEVLHVPEPLIEADAGLVPGLDGRKMSKS